MLTKIHHIDSEEKN